MNILCSFAQSQIKRKKSRTVITAAAISLSAALLTAVVNFVASGNIMLTGFLGTDYGYAIMADYTAKFKNTINPKTGRRQQECAYPIDAKTAEDVTDKLREYDKTDVYGSGQDYSTYVAILAPQDITGDMRQVLSGQYDEDQPEIILEVGRIILDDEHYRELCRQAKAPYGGVILLNDYKYNDNGTERYITPMSMVTSTLKLADADGSLSFINIDGVLETAKIPRQLTYPNTNPVRLVIPSAGVSVRGYNWMASPEDEDGFMEYARAVLESYFPQHGMDYDEAGYVSRVYGAQDFARLMNIAIILAAFFSMPLFFC